MRTIVGPLRVNPRLQPRPLDGFVFDLDDTLCLEQDYVRSGFAHVAGVCATAGTVSQFEVERFLNEEFEKGTRGNTFNLLLERFPQLATHVNVDRLVREYREHSPRIDGDADLLALIDFLRAGGAKIGVITDGPVASQRAKFHALKLEPRVNVAVFTDEFGLQYRKPHDGAYRHTGSVFGVEAARCVYVGDNPQKDFYAPRQLGWHTVRLRLPLQARCGLEPASSDYAADCEFTSVRELVEYLSDCSALARAATQSRGTH